MVRPQSEQTRMLCQRLLICSVMKQKALWKCGVVTDIQESKKCSTGVPGLCTHSSHEQCWCDTTTSATVSVTFHHFRNA